MLHISDDDDQPPIKKSAKPKISKDTFNCTDCEVQTSSKFKLNGHQKRKHLTPRTNQRGRGRLDLLINHLFQDAQPSGSRQAQSQQQQQQQQQTEDKEFEDFFNDHPKPWANNEHLKEDYRQHLFECLVGIQRYCNTKTSRNGVNNMWILKNSTSLLSSLDQLDVRTAKSVQTFDFSTLYTSIPHDLLKSRISNLVHNAFRKKDGSVRYTHIKLTRAKGYFTHDINGGGDNMFTADSICEMIEFLIDNIFVQFGGRLFRQVIGIPMGTNCAPLLADLFLYSYENEFLDNMIRSGHRRLARSFNLCYRYIDDLIAFNNKKFLDYLKEIYPSQLMVEKANKSDHLADYLDLTFIIDSGGKLSTRLYDKRDDFDFHIVNFPFLSSNIPSGPSYGVYISQLIRYARCCSHYDDFRYRHKCLVDRLLSQGYKALRLEKSFKKFYGRYQDLIEKYRRSVNAMVSDSFPGQFLFNM